MAELPDDLLIEVRAFLGGPLAEESAALSAACDQQRRCLLRKLLSMAVEAARTSSSISSSGVYLDMNGVKANSVIKDNMRTSASGLNRMRSRSEDDVDSAQNRRNSCTIDQVARPTQVDSCTACSMCTGCDSLFPCDDSTREPSALEAKMSADLVRCGKLWRLWSVPLPLFGKRRRHCWAALLPGKLLVYASEKSSRPKDVLPLRASCSAAYSVRTTADAAVPYAFELCCPGRKTHQLLAANAEDVSAWMEAIKIASCVPLRNMSNKTATPCSSIVSADASCSSANARGDAAAVAEHSSPTTTATAAAVAAASAAATAVLSHSGNHSAGDQSESAAEDAQQYEPMSPEPTEASTPPNPADDIYHDIAPPGTPPSPPAPQSSPAPQEQPHYENGEVSSSAPATTSAAADDKQDNERPVYDDVAQLHHYKNLPSPQAKADTSQEIVYDDVGGTCAASVQGFTSGALYELIDNASSSGNDKRLST